MKVIDLVKHCGLAPVTFLEIKEGSETILVSSAYHIEQDYDKANKGQIQNRTINTFRIKNDHFLEVFVK